MADDPTIEIEPTIARERICVDAEHPNLSWVTTGALDAELVSRGYNAATAGRHACPAVVTVEEALEDANVDQLFTALHERGIPVHAAPTLAGASPDEFLTEARRRVEDSAALLPELIAKGYRIEPSLREATEVQLRAEWDRRGHTMAPTLRTAETRDIVTEANRRGYAVIPETGFENALTNPDLKLVPLERLLAEVGRRLDRRS